MISLQSWKVELEEKLNANGHSLFEDDDLVALLVLNSSLEDKHIMSYSNNISLDLKAAFCRFAYLRDHDSSKLAKINNLRAKLTESSKAEFATGRFHSPWILELFERYCIVTKQLELPELKDAATLNDLRENGKFKKRWHETILPVVRISSFSESLIKNIGEFQANLVSKFGE